MKLSTPLIITVLAASLTTRVVADLVTFDDLPSPGNNIQPVQNGYDGFQWNNVGYLNSSNSLGFDPGVVSPPNGGITTAGSSTIMRSTPFTFNSVYFTVSSPADVTLTVDVRGFNGATQLYNQIITIDHTTTLYTFDYLNITSLEFDTTNSSSFDNLNFSLSTNFASTTPNLTPNQQAVATNIDLNSITPGPNVNAIITALRGLQTSQLPAAFDQLSPQQFGQFASTLAFNNASFETESMDNYLAGLRQGPNGTFVGGNGNIDASGLTLNDPSYDPSLAMVHSRLMAWNAGPIEGTVSDVAGPVLGGVDMKDNKDMKSMAAPAYTNPWNFFIRGNVILAQGLSQADVSHFDENTESVELGTDYRITPNLLVGLKAGYGHTDVTLDNNGSSATVDSYSPGLYASYANHGWYANLSGDYIHNAYTQSRDIGFLDQTANSAPEGNEGVADLDGGYEFHHGALTYGPLVGVQYTHLSVDGYNETGSVADLDVADQNADSLRSRLGGRVSYTFSHSGINFTPHLDASWQHEFMDQSRGITSQFSDGVGSFSVSTDNPSRDSALADLGLDAQFNRTITVFTNYQVQAGQENYFGQSFQAGVKIGF
jgi:uncharacterized protein with beta-barrel porin domain